MADLTQFGRLNVWALVKGLVENKVGPFIKAGAPSGSDFAGNAATGALVIDTQTGELYQNVGTSASPVWLQKTGGAGRLLKLTAALTPASVPANSTSEQTFTVTGVAVGDVIAVNKPTYQAGLGIVGARVSAANQIALTFINITAAPIVPTAETYSFLVVR
ncbi:MAG: hypothetical protein QXE45_04440 [Thermoplasmata archaeon]